MPLTPEDRIRIQNEEIYKAEQEEYRTEVRNQIRKTALSWGWPQKVGILLLTIVALAVIQRVCEYNRDDEVKQALCYQEAVKAAEQQGYRIAGGTSGTVRPYFSKEYGQCYIRTE